MDAERKAEDAAIPGGQRRATVLVDMDGVLCDFDDGVFQAYGARFPEEPTLAMRERKNFYMRKNYEESFGAAAGARVKQITESEGFFEQLEPIAGALEALVEMDKDPRLNVLLCTSPLSHYEFVLREKYAWVDKHLGSEWTKRIIMTKDKTMVLGDVLIDDRPEVCGCQAPPRWEHVLFDQPYNRHCTDKRRLRSWAPEEWRPLIESLFHDGAKKSSGR